MAARAGGSGSGRAVRDQVDSVEPARRVAPDRRRRGRFQPAQGCACGARNIRDRAHDQRRELRLLFGAGEVYGSG